MFYREIHYSVDERKSGRNSGRTDDIKDVIVHELCSRGGCFFRFSHRLCDGNIGNGVSQRASDARLTELRQVKYTDVRICISALVYKWTLFSLAFPSGEGVTREARDG